MDLINVNVSMINADNIYHLYHFSYYCCLQPFSTLFQRKMRKTARSLVNALYPYTSSLIMGNEALNMRTPSPWTVISNAMASLTTPAAHKGGHAPTAAARSRGIPTGSQDIPGVSSIIAVASGKGGVGKSTTAVNLAAALSNRLGLSVGLLDVDVFGPSIPTMMNLKGQPEISEFNQMLPLENHGVRCMSMGFLLSDDAPAVWRGPMVMSAVEKLVFGTDWGRLDVLVLDMPPGTGDAQLSIGQRLKLAGAVIVSTPQDIALIDARRGANMFQKINIPIVGLIENMSHYECRKCGNVEHPFGSGGVERTAKDMGLEVLGGVPLQLSVRENADAGTPVVLADPESPSARAYVEIARRIAAKLRLGAAGGEEDRGGNAAGKGGPRIVVDE